METKKCSTCKTEKPVTDYYKNTSRKDNLQSQCKACVNIKKRLHYQNNKEKYKKAYQEFLKRNPNYTKKNPEKNPEKNPN